MDTHIQWAAGLVDGDGWVSLERKKTAVPRWYPTVGVVSEDKYTLDRLRSILGVGYVALEKNKSNVYYYGVWGDAAFRVAEMIEPYLVVKKQQAQTLIVSSAHATDRREIYANTLKALKNGEGLDYAFIRDLPSSQMLPWLAGLFDSDGCVEVSFEKYKSRYILRCTINITCGAAVELAQRIVGFGSIGFQVSKKGYKNLWYWKVGNKGAGHALTSLEPYLVTKKAQAASGILFANLPKGNCKRPPSPEMIADREYIYLRLQQMKKGESSGDTRMVGAHIKPAYRVISPEGNEHLVSNLREFSDRHGLTPQAMYSLASPKPRLKYHKGWTCQKIVV